MINRLIIGKYIPGSSPLHNLDPRSKLLAGLIFIIALFFVKSATGYVILGFFLVMLITVSQIDWKLYLKGLKPVLFIAVITFTFHLFLTPGEIWQQLGPLTLTREGIKHGVYISLRLVYLVAGASLLTFTTSPVSLTDGLERVLSKGRRIGIPSHEIAMMMSIALRFIPIIADEADKISKALTARGLDPAEAGFADRIKLLVPLLVALLVSIFRRAEELAISMESRCYQGGNSRTRLRELTLHAGDYLAVLLTSLVAASVVIAGW